MILGVGQWVIGNVLSLGRVGLTRHQRQFFDSADYAMQGKAAAAPGSTSAVVATRDNIAKKEKPRPSSMVSE